MDIPETIAGGHATEAEKEATGDGLAGMRVVAGSGGSGNAWYG